MMKKNDKAVLLFLLPGAAGFFVFFLVPFAGGLYFSMINNIFEKNFVGLANFIELAKNPVFLLALKNTMIFAGICVPLVMITALTLAVLLQDTRKGSAFYRGAIVLPLAVPTVSVIAVWTLLFDERGYINFLLNLAGLPPVGWLGGDMLRWPVILLYLWKNCGYCMILFLAGLTSLPKEVYEASSIDGAGWFTKMFRITLPLMFPTVFFVFIISTINTFKIFKEAYLMGGAYPPDGIYLVQHYINNQLSRLNYEKLASAAYIFAACIYGMVSVVFRLENKFGREV